MAKTSLRYTKTEFEANVKNFLQKISLTPNSFEHYFLAFVHKSVLNETEFYTESNERLEFLGDAILELTITEKLFHDFPTKPE